MSDLAKCGWQHLFTRSRPCSLQGIKADDLGLSCIVKFVLCVRILYFVFALGTWGAHFLKRATLPWGPLQRSTGPLEAAPDSIGLSSNPAFLHIASCAYTCLISKPKIGNVLCVLPNYTLTHSLKVLPKAQSFWQDIREAGPGSEWCKVLKMLKFANCSILKLYQI